MARSYAIVAGSKLWRRTVLCAYLAMLAMCFPEEAKRVESCGKQSMKYECVGQERTEGYRPLCCRSPLCPWCSATDTRRLVDYFLYRVHEMYGKLHRRIRFWRYEITCPYDLRARVVAEGLAKFEKVAKRIIERYAVEVMGIPKGLQLGMLQVVQNWHTSDPFGSKRIAVHPHVHGLIFDFGFDGERVVPFSKMFVSNDKGFVRLRMIVREEIEAEYGQSRARDVDAYLRYEEGGDELRHRVSYMFRSPVKDVYAWVKGYGVPKDYDEVWVRQMLRGRGHAQRVHYYGWLAPVCQSPKSQFMGFLRLELLNRQSYDSERKKVYCPNCGCLMEPVRYAVEDTASLIARGEQFVVHLPPWLVLGLAGG